MYFARSQFPQDRIARLHCLSTRAPSPTTRRALHPLWSACIPGICRRIMLLKGTAAAGWEARLVERRFRGEAENVQAHGRGSICFLERRRAFFRRPLRNQAVHHVSPSFHLSLLAESRPHTRKRIQDDSKQTDVGERGMRCLINLEITFPPWTFWTNIRPRWQLKLKCE